MSTINTNQLPIKINTIQVAYPIISGIFAFLAGFAGNNENNND